MSLTLLILWIVRHAFFFAGTVGLALCCLSWIVRWLAERRSLPVSVHDHPGKTLWRLVLIGAAGQLAFFLMSLLLSSPMARLIALLIVGAAAGWSASRSVAYLPVLRGVLFGAIGGGAMQIAYQMLAPHNDSLARIVAALVLVAMIALAVTLPLPPFVIQPNSKRTWAGIGIGDKRLSGRSRTIQTPPRNISDPKVRNRSWFR